MYISIKSVSHLRWSVDFSGYSSLLHQLTDIHDTTELLSKVVLNTTTAYLHAYTTYNAHIAKHFIRSVIFSQETYANLLIMFFLDHKTDIS